MHGVDYLIVVVMTISVLIGTARGFVREAIALVTWVVAIAVAWRFSGFVHPYLDGALPNLVARTWVARAVVFLGVMVCGSLVGAIVGHLTHRGVGLSLVDRLVGVLFGLARGAVLVGFAALLGERLSLQHQPWWVQSRLAPYAVDVAAWLEKVSGETRILAESALESVSGSTDPQEHR
jgi:membrane protein required for colicin V production